MVNKVLNKTYLTVLLACCITSSVYAQTNSTGSILFPRDNETKTNNLMLAVSQANDPEGIQRIDMRFADSENPITICDNGCGSGFRKPLVGINPFNYGQQPGALQLQLWITDNQNTEQLVDSVDFTWQPELVSNIEAERIEGSITVSWLPVSNASRYNLYLATEEGITPANANSKENAQIFRSLTNTSQVVTGFNDEDGVFALVTAIDRSGESGFSEELKIPVLNNEPPVAIDDQYVLDEDDSITENVLDNDSDAEAAELTAKVLTPPEHGQLTLQADGRFIYQPSAHFFGEDRFIYEVLDDANGSDKGTVTLTINAINDAPVAADDSYQLQEDSNLAVSTADGLLVNDADVDQDELVTSLITGPSKGALSLNDDGSFDYTPQSNAFGLDTFTYQVSDGSDGVATASVALTIINVNDPPQANADSYTIKENTSLNAGTGELPSLFANDLDADLTLDNPQELTASLLTSPSNGQLALNTDGTFTYVPTANFSGNDGFRYLITDSAGLTSEADVVITIESVNDAPVTSADSYQTNEDTSLVITAANGVLSNDFDPDLGDSIAASLASQPNLGSVSLAADGSFSYTPNDNAFGQDTFRYFATDAAGLATEGQVTIAMAPVNDRPIAENDEASTELNQSVTIDVLANDSDPDGELLSITTASTSAGNAQISGQQIAFTPSNNFFGTAIINYTISDPTGLTANAAVSVEVATGRVVQATNDQLTTAEDVSETIDVLTNDDGNGVLSLVLASANNGTAIITSNNEIEYTPSANFFGNDVIEYTLQDSTNAQASAQVAVTVTSVPDQPIANNDTATTNTDSKVIIDVLANDTDGDGDPLTITQANTDRGIVLILDNKLEFTPSNGFSGIANINYQVSDGTSSDNGNVVVNVNSPLLATNDTATVNEDASITIDVLANDSGDGVLTLLSASASNGTVTINASNQLVYSPSADFNGNDSINYSMTDTSGEAMSATVNVTVTPVNDSPVAVNDTATTSESSAIVINVLANDSDIDGDTLTLSSVNVDQGTVFISSNQINYTPESGFSGVATINYVVTDGSLTASASVSVTVTASSSSNLLAVNDAVNTNEDENITIYPLANDSGTGGLVLISVNAQNGTATINSSTHIIYSPNAHFNGNDTLVYVMSDDTGVHDTAEIAVTISPVNDAPVANNDTVTTQANTSITIDALGNDTDLDNDPLSIIQATVDTGTVHINSNKLDYTPSSGFDGEATINYTISDGVENASAVISVNVQSNQVIAINDSATTAEDSAVNINVLANDSGSSGLIVTTATATNGAVTIESDNTISYLPNANFNGSDTINYSITDDTSTTASASVTMSITPVNDAPEASNDTVTTQINTLVVIDVLANDTDVDNDALTVSAATADTGSVAINSDQTLNYTPESGFTGVAVINYTVSDSSTSDSGVVTITVETNQVIANNDTTSTNEDTSVNIDVLANDVGSSGLIVTSATSSEGPVTIESDHSLTFTPNPEFSGSASITYSITDVSNTTAIAVVNVTVNPVNDAPNSVNDVYFISSFASVTIPADVGVLANDTDIEGDAMTATKLIGPTHASSFTLHSDGSFTYQHDNSDNLVDMFTYQASDSSVTGAATVMINIAKENDIAKICNIPPLTAQSGQAFSFDLQTINPDNDSLIFTASGLPSWLTLTGNTLAGTPTDGDIGLSNNIQIAVTDGKDPIGHSLNNIYLNVSDNFGNGSYSDFSYGTIGGDSRVNDIAVDRKGNIVAVGSANDSGDTIAVARFKPNGTLDTSFNGTGWLTLDLVESFDEQATAVKIDKHNNLFISAYGSEDATNQDHDFYLIKLLSNGSYDTSFGNNGIANFDLLTDKTDQAMDVLLHSDGDITLVGHTESGSDDFDLALVHLNADGSLDSSFGSGGSVIFTESNNQLAAAALLDNKGYIYITGTYSQGNDNDVFLMRTTVDGADASFNSGSGSIFSYYEEGEQTAKDIILDSNGDLLIVGASNDDFVAYSFTLDNNATPELETANFSSGMLVHDIGSQDVAHKVVSDRQGHLYLVGVTGSSTVNKAMLKLNSDGTIETSFGSSGVMIDTSVNGNSGSVAAASLNASGQLLSSGPNSTNTRLTVDMVNANSNFTCNITTLESGTYKTTDALTSASVASNGDMYFGGQSVNPADGQTDFVLFKTQGFAVPGSDFGEGGMIRHDSGSTNASLVLDYVVSDSNNSAYLVGHVDADKLYLAKYTVAGQLDTSFSDQGVNAFGFGDLRLSTAAALVDTSDNLYLAGTNNSKATLMKITATGDFDNGFAAGLEQLAFTDSNFVVNDMALLSDGSIYLVGGYSTTNDSGPITQLAVVKYTNTGVLDTSFGLNGLVEITTSYNSEGIAVTTNGSYLYILVKKNTDDVEVRKLLSNGNTESSFANAGILDLPGFKSHAKADIQYTASSSSLLIQVHDSAGNNQMLHRTTLGTRTVFFINAGDAPYTHNLGNWDAINGFVQTDDDTILIYGAENSDFAVSVMMPNGVVFNGMDELLFDGGFGHTAHSITTDKNSKILLAGSAYNSSTNSADFAYGRFNFDGTADSTLTGSSAIQITPDAGNQEEVHKHIMVTPSNEIQVAGNAFSSSDPDDNNIKGHRTTQGTTSIDSNYAGGGFDFDLASISNDLVEDQLLLSDGSTVLVGSLNNQAVLIKLDQSGLLDASFGTGGYQQINMGDSSALFGVTQDVDGKIVAVGEMVSSAKTNGVIIRVNADSGTLDTSFDTNGNAQFDNSDLDRFNDVAVTPEGNYVAVGISDGQTLIAQFKPDGSAYTTFNGVGFITNGLGINDEAMAVTIGNYGAITVLSQTAESVIILRYTDIGNLILLSEYYPPAVLVKVSDMTMDHLGNAYVTGQMQIEQKWQWFTVKFNAVASPL